MSQLTDLLRGKILGGSGMGYSHMRDAANEIDRLEAENLRLTQELLAAQQQQKNKKGRD